jgi:prephenate dehydrogenase
LNIGIVGLGLMGGSFAMTLRKYNLATKVLGYDHNIEHQKQALDLNLVDEIVTLEKLKKVDLLILAIPVDGIISFLNEIKTVSKDTTIIDFGSTKELIVNNLPQALKPNFIPAHPMTGTEKFGPSAAIDNLYENKIVVLCDLDKCDDRHKQKAIKIFDDINMDIVYMNSKEHDIHTSYISHLPHAISYALANTVMEHEDPKYIISLAAGGFKDMSRIAKSSPNMWTDIFRQNRENLLDGIEIFEKQIANMKQLLKNENYDQINKWMSKANTLHEIL